jgi:hypothetical protein
VLKYTNKLWKNRLDRRHIREEVRDVIYNQLVALRINQRKKTMFAKIEKRVGHGQLFFSFMRLLILLFFL